MKLAPFRIYGGTFPRLNQTGEGFLHKLGSPVGPKQDPDWKLTCISLSHDEICQHILPTNDGVRVLWNSIGFESVWVYACVSGVITRRQFCVLLYGCSSCWESFARKAHSETLTCISRYIYPFANALLGKFSRIDLHTLACPRNIHRNA